MPRMTDVDKTALKLIQRSPQDKDGWAECSYPVFDRIIIPTPDALIEKDFDGRKARLTDEALTILKWT